MRCQRCKEKLIKNKQGRPKKYCSDCAYITKLDQMRHWQWKYKNLGTTNFKSYRKKDFNKEIEDINKEYRQLGIKKDK